MLTYCLQNKLQAIGGYCVRETKSTIFQFFFHTKQTILLYKQLQILQHS